MEGARDRAEGQLVEQVSSLLHGNSASGAGAYNSFDRWTTSLRSGDLGSASARLVTVHELMHAALNESTAFGSLVMACATLRQAEGEAFTAPLTRLIGQCRSVHEAFATFQSLWVVAEGNLSYLEEYPRYVGWYRDAADLVPLPDHFRRKELMIEVAARASMQAPVLERLAAGASPNDQAWAVPRLQRPDERFALLHALVDGAFWNRAWTTCQVALSDNPLFAALTDADNDVRLRASTYDAQFSDAIAVCTKLLYAQVSALLDAHDAPTLGFDENRESAAAVVRAVEAASPRARGLLVPPDSTRSLKEEWFDLWDRERLIVRERPRRAHLLSLEEAVRTHRATVFLSDKDGQLHVFGTVRPTFRLLEQFDIDRPERIATLGNTPVVTLCGLDRDGVLCLTVLDQPHQLADVRRSLPRGITVHLNISLAALGDDVWRRQWQRRLKKIKLTGLLDLPAAVQFDLWRRTGEPLSFAQGTLQDMNGEQADLLVLKVGSFGPPILVICTAVTGHALSQYLRDSYPGARHNKSLINDRMTDIELVTSHLLSEECFFDLSAYHQGDPT
ncbi:MAG: hypothetical protein QG597_4657 [Actinomycetota bacterium]|nr:hypothetical protein [Actinomycetota bacterium]